MNYIRNVNLSAIITCTIYIVWEEGLVYVNTEKTDSCIPVLYEVSLEFCCLL